MAFDKVLSRLLDADRLYAAAVDLFERELRIPLKKVTSLRVPVEQLAAEHFRPVLSERIASAHFLGLVSDEAFDLGPDDDPSDAPPDEAVECARAESAREDYEGLGSPGDSRSVVRVLRGDRERGGGAIRLSHFYFRRPPSCQRFEDKLSTWPHARQESRQPCRSARRQTFCRSCWPRLTGACWRNCWPSWLVTTPTSGVGAWRS